MRACRVTLGVVLSLSGCGDDAPATSTTGGTATGVSTVNPTSGPSTVDSTVTPTTSPTNPTPTASSADTATGTGEEDCNGPDPTGDPNADEICDGIDQDCDGEIDEGVPNDGAGCQDPGAPMDGPEIDEIHITVHTADVDFADTDDPVEVCFPGIGLCESLDVPDWNDRERGRYDVVQLAGNGALVDAVDSMVVEVVSGTNRWEPEGFEVVIDGVPVYCRDELEIYMGTEGGAEVVSWEDPGGFALHCTTVWPEVLTHGPMVGSIGPDSAQIWYRTDATRQVQLRVATDEGDLAAAPVVDYGYPRYQEDFAETVAVQGLMPNTTYFYDLEIEGERFGPWSFTTAPVVGTAATWRLAFGSCGASAEQPIFHSIRAWDPDVFLFAGDNHYADSADLVALRQHYRWVHGRPARAQMLHETSIVAVWDDHDFTGNNTDGTASGKAVALEAFTEYWANPSYGTDRTLGVFTTYAYGDVDIIVIDDRYYRGLDDSITGDAQEQWLFDELSTSTATFKLVLSGSQFTLEGTGDSWAVFPEAQTRLRAHIANNNITGVVLLSGDVHRSEFRLLPATLGGYPLPELTSSPLTSGPSSCGTATPERQECFSGGHYFVGVEVDTTAADPSLVATIFDVDGSVLADWTILRSQLE